MNKLILLIGVVLISFSCKKSAGPGGSSAIIGKVTGANVTSGKNEITEIIVTSGADLEHGDYFIINGLSGNPNYYFWFKNPNWVSDGDPNLGGRIGVQVDFNYSDSNLEIAQSVYNAMYGALSIDFDLSVSNDIITLTSKNSGAISDADDMTTSFLVDVTEQGKNETIGNTVPQIDEKVYLIYGEGDHYHEMERTGGDGDFIFPYLRKGEYKVYVVSKNLNTGEMTEKILKEVSITGNKSVVDAGEFFMYH